MRIPLLEVLVLLQLQCQETASATVGRCNRTPGGDSHQMVPGMEWDWSCGWIDVEVSSTPRKCTMQCNACCSKSGGSSWRSQSTDAVGRQIELTPAQANVKTLLLLLFLFPCYYCLIFEVYWTPSVCHRERTCTSWVILWLLFLLQWVSAQHAYQAGGPDPKWTPGVVLVSKWGSLAASSQENEIWSDSQQTMFFLFRFVLLSWHQGHTTGKDQWCTQTVPPTYKEENCNCNCLSTAYTYMYVHHHSLVHSNIIKCAERNNYLGKRDISTALDYPAALSFSSPLAPENKLVLL